MRKNSKINFGLEPENTDEVDPLQEIQEDLENCLIAERKKLAPLAKSLLED